MFFNVWMVVESTTWLVLPPVGAHEANHHVWLFFDINGVEQHSFNRGVNDSSHIMVLYNLLNEITLLVEVVHQCVDMM